MIPVAYRSAIDAAEVVSFDLFDTLIVRATAEPRHVFDWIERELVASHGTSFLGFADARFAAEVDEAAETWASDRGAEFALGDVYQRLGRKHPVFVRLVPVAELVQLELRAERLACRRHPWHGDLFDAALAAGKRVTVVSDTYLPEDHLEAVLTDAGYRGWERLFASNAVGTNKASGRLFRALVEAVDVPANRIVHFGDRELSDVVRAKESGLVGVLVQRGDALLAERDPRLVELGRDGGVDRLDSSLFLGVQYADASRHPSEVDDLDPLSVAHDIGHRVLGPLGYAFASWVAEQAQLRRLERLYFVSREGWFLQQLYDAVAPRLGCEVPSEYFYGSRRMIRMTVATENMVDSMLRFLGKVGPLQAYLDSLGLELSDQDLRRFDFDDRSAVVRREDLAELFRAHADRLAVIRDEERADYLAYLRETGLASADRVGLVDSGWYGTSQHALTRLLRESGHDVKLTGLYIGLSPKHQSTFSEDSAAFGFLYHFHPSWWRDTRPFLDLARMLELLLAAPTPSVRRMRRAEHGVAPVFVKEPFEEHLNPICEAMQRSALGFAQTFANALPGDPPRLDAELARGLVEGLIASPSPAQARCIGQLPYDKSSFNNDDSSTFLPSPEEALREFRSNPRRLHSAFASSNWRHGYLASLDSETLRRLLLASEPALWEPKGLPARVYQGLRRQYRRLRGRDIS